MSSNVDYYRTQSRWTDPGRWAPLLLEVLPDPHSLPHAAGRLLLHPFVAPMRGVEIPPAAADDRDIRSVEAMLDRVHQRDARPLAVERAPEQRLFCVCAGFARVATAVLRQHAVPARCRVGFAAYFNPGFLEDHWVCEYWDGEGWCLLDAQLDEAAAQELGITFAPWNVPRDQFIDASTAWRRMRAAELDPAKMGLSVLGLTGTWFVVGNVMLDVAALNKEEMLPWEKWSIGRECGPGHELASEWAEQLDQVARLLAGAPDAPLAQRVYRERDWLRVTPTVLSMLRGGPVEVDVR
jgi:Transglutaminase-like superfamily